MDQRLRMSHPTSYSAGMNNRNRSKLGQPPPAASEAESLVRNQSATTAKPVQPGSSSTKLSGQHILAERMVKMGISTVPPAFPPDGISLVQLVPWWRLWPREPRKNRLENYGAAVLPAVASGLVTLEAHASLGQAIFTAMLPMHALSTAVAQWTEWAIGSIFDKAYPGPAPLLGVLEHLLQNQSEMTRAEAWSRILESAFDKEGQFRYGPEDHAIALLGGVVASLVSGP